MLRLAIKMDNSPDLEDEYGLIGGGREKVLNSFTRIPSLTQGSEGKGGRGRGGAVEGE